MILPPSKKIFIGATAALTGVGLQVVLSVLLSMSLEAVASGKAGNALQAAEIDHKMGQLQDQMGLGINGMTASWIFLLFGVVMLLTGVYQNAKTTEALAARLAQPEACNS